jgi:hypothetical protein
MNRPGFPEEACFGCLNRECLRRRETPPPAFPPRTLLIQALAALLPPVLAFPGIFWGLGRLSPAPGEPVRAAAGLIGLFGTAFLIYRRRSGCRDEARGPGGTNPSG